MNIYHTKYTEVILYIIGGDSHHDDDNMADEIDGGLPLAEASVNQPMETEHNIFIKYLVF